MAMELTESSALAKDALDRAVIIGYTPSEYYSTLGLLHHHLAQLDLDEIEIARQAYEKAIELNDNNVFAYVWLASLISEQTLITKKVDSVDHLAQAMQIKQVALKLDPKNRVANGNYQINLFTSGRHQQALENLKLLTEVDSEYMTYYTILANFHGMLGHYTGASEWVLKADGFSARKTFIVFRLIRNMNRTDLIDRFYEQLNDDNPAYERLMELREAHGATPAELVAKAQVALLQPDYDGWSAPVSRFLYQRGEYEWSKKLQENMFAELLRETPRILVSDGSLPRYASTLHLAGYSKRARALAQQGLQANKNRIRIAPRGEWLDDAIFYLILGREEEAMIEIESAYAEGFRLYYTMIDDNPIYDSIRSDPRMLSV